MSSRFTNGDHALYVEVKYYNKYLYIIFQNHVHQIQITLGKWNALWHNENKWKLYIV